ASTPPFTGGDFIQLGYQHNYEPYRPFQNHVSHVPPIVEHVVMRALAKDPHQLFASVQSFAAALEEAYQTSLSFPVDLSTQAPLPDEPSLQTDEMAATSQSQTPA